jgi:hypothetical protein
MSHEQAVTTMAAARYLIDEMTDVERDAFEEHYFSCPECAADVRAGEQLRTGVREAYTAEAAKQRTVLPFRPKVRAFLRPLVVLPWAAAATLLVAVSYQSAVTIPSLRHMTEAQALATVTLRPMSRGEQPVVTVPQAAQFVSLALDVSVDDGAVYALHYQVRDAQGKDVASGNVAKPADGSSLVLLLPAHDLAPGHYVAELRNAVDGGGVIGEYPFSIAR